MTSTVPASTLDGLSGFAVRGMGSGGRRGLRVVHFIIGLAVCVAYVSAVLVLWLGPRACCAGTLLRVRPDWRRVGWQCARMLQ